VKFVIAAVVLIGGIALAAVLLRSPSSQVVQLESTSAAKNAANSSATEVKTAPIAKPVELDSTPKPRPTEPIRPRQQPAPPVQSDDLLEPEGPSNNDSSTTSSPAQRSAPTRAEETSTEAAVQTPASSTSKLAVRLEAGSWRLQAGAFRTENNAVIMKERLESSGLKAVVARGADGIYRVLVGEYFSSNAAKADAERVANLLK
jgi:cell division protein FtsN